MNTNALKKFAQETRRKLMEQVAAKIQYVLHTDSPVLREKSLQVQALRQAIEQSTESQVIDKVAYTWFNRLMALRFMDANDYQPLGIRIITPKEGYTLPELLDEAKQGNIPTELTEGSRPLVDIRLIHDLLDGRIPSHNAQNEVYTHLLIGACNHLSQVFPFLYERIEDYSELLLPDDLTSERSVVNDIRTGMNDTDCQEVEIIGWLYQFYISEKNEELISSKKAYNKNELAPASQLFTPKWIVEYMVDNTLGQLWKEIKPETQITNDLKFYIKPDYELPKREKKSIEDIKFFEPCVGSGHILSYAFDLFYKIYEEEGYNPTEIPELIISKNLYGVDIDQRAAQLASFILLMKGRQKSRRFLRNIKNNNLRPNISFYQDFKFDDKFSNATAIGSLIRVDSADLAKITVDSGSLFAARQEELQFLYKLLSQKYDVVVTNPPYINSSRMEGSLKTYVETNHPETKTDLFATFILRCLEYCNEDGLTGYMTPFVWMFIQSYEQLRKIIIDNHFINNLIQLEYSGFDGATVPICTFTLRNKAIIDGKGNYIKLSKFKGSENQAPKTIEAIQNLNCGWFFKAVQEDFEKIPEYRLGYWLSKKQIDTFEKDTQLGKNNPPKAGLSTANNERFLRYWNEVKRETIDFNCESREDLERSQKWIPMTKGGTFRRWFGNNEYILNWEKDGTELKYWLINNPNDPSTKSWSRYIRNYSMYCKSGISFSDVSSGIPAFRFQDKGFIPNSRGPFIYSESKSLLGYLNSKVCVSFLEVLSPTLTFNVGDISRVPFLDEFNNELKITETVATCIEISKQEWNSRETSWDFQQNELLRIKGKSDIDLEEAYDLYKAYWQKKFFELHRNEEELNRQFIEIYGLQDELSPDVPLDDITILKEETSIQNNQLVFDATEVMAQFISYAVGCTFGRYQAPQSGAGAFLPDDDNIVPVLDDEWFEDDIVGRFKEFLKVTFGTANFERNLAFVEESLGKDIRKYFVKDFYADHIKRYKKRPIYWMFSSGNSSFNVLIYMHRYTPDTLNKILNGYLVEYLEKLNNRIESLNHIIVSGSSTEQTKAAKEQDKIKKTLLELKEYEREILYPLATERINIDLDDGVLVNYNKFGAAIKEISGLNDKATKKKVKEFDWIDGKAIR